MRHLRFANGMQWADISMHSDIALAKASLSNDGRFGLQPDWCGAIQCESFWPILTQQNGQYR